MIRTALVPVLCVLVILVVVPQVAQAKDSLYEQKMARGVLAFESGKFPEAAGEFQAALSEKPRDGRGQGPQGGVPQGGLLGPEPFPRLSGPGRDTISPG
jgi:hypothetical protein